MRLLPIFTLLLCSFVGTFARAEALVVFTPESLAQNVDERCTSVQLARLAEQEADAALEIARTAYLPDVNANWQLGYLGDGYLTNRNFSDGMHVVNPHFVNNFAVEAMQLIYTGGAVTGSISMAQLAKQMSQLSIEECRLQMRFYILSSLIDLDCANKRADVLKNNIELAQQLLETMHARFDEGVVLKSDITRYELQVTDLQLQLDRVNEQITTTNARIATALNYPLETTFALNTESIDENYPIAAMSQWLDEATDRNIAIRKSRLGIDMSKTKLKIVGADRLPHVGAFIYGHFDSPIVTEVPVINKNFMYWGFGINISYNISSLFKTNRSLEKARVGIIESQRQLDLADESITDDVVKAYNAYLTACSELRTRRSSLRLAEENYRIVSERFNEGMALVTDLVDAANVKIAAQSGLDNAQSMLLFCLYKLRYISNQL